MGSNGIIINIGANTGAVDEALQATTGESEGLAVALKESGAAGLEAGEAITEGMAKADYSIREARESSRLLSEELGIHLPRALSSMAAQSEVLGPLLGSAFSVVAVTALVPVVEQAVEKLSKFVGATYDGVESDEQFAASITKTTAALDAEQKKVEGLSREMQLLGKSSSEQAALKLKFDTEDAREHVADITKQIAVLEEKLSGSGLTAVQSFTDGLDKAFGAGTPAADAARQKVTQLQAELKVAQATLSAASQATEEKITLDQDTEWDRRVKAAETAYEKIQRLVSENAKSVKPGPDPYAATIEQANEVQQEQLALREKDNDAVIKEYESTVKLQEAQLKLNEAVTAEAVTGQETLVAKDKATGNTAKQRADEQALVALLEQEKTAQLAIVDAKLGAAKADVDAATPGSAGYNDALARYTEYEAERVKITADADRKIAAAQDAELKQESKELTQYLGKFNSQFASSFASVAMGQETLGKAAQKMFMSMETAALQSLAKIALAELEGFIGYQSLAEKKQLTDAKGAAAGAYSAVAGVPIIGPILAPIAAATAFAGVMAFEQGGVVPETQMALVHENEMVLPAHLSEAFQDMVEGGGSGGGTHHYHINAVDSKSFHQLLQRNPEAFGKAMERSVASGHASISKMQRGK